MSPNPLRRLYKLEHMVETYVDLVLGSSLPDELRADLLFSGDPARTYERIEPSRLSGTPIPAPPELGAVAPEGPVERAGPVALSLGGEREALFLPHSWETGLQLPAVALSKMLIGRYPDHRDLTSLSLEEVLSFRERLALSLMREVGLPADRTLAEESALRSTKVWPLLSILKVPGVLEIYANLGARPRVDHDEWGRVTLANLVADRRMFSAVRTIVEIAPFAALDAFNPSVEVEFRECGISARVAIDVHPAGTSSLDIRNLSAMPRLSLPRLISLGTLSADQALLALSSIRSGVPLIVAGPTGSGKTTLCNALISACPRWWRVISIEKVAEIEDLSRYGFDFCRLPSRGRPREETLFVLLHRNPDLVFFGEVLTPEDARVLALTVSSGLRTVATIHASSIGELRRKLSLWGLDELLSCSTVFVMSREKKVVETLGPRVPLLPGLGAAISRMEESWDNARVSEFMSEVWPSA